ncbi:MAG: helix-turn-helix domain-containing protein [bacterium]|nr:helix-turn-helix domain-containing protein [bacterium]
MLNEDLKKIGLNDKESQVYLTLLELGEGSIGTISKKSSIKRTTVYDVVNSLMEKGLLSVRKKDKKKVYVAESPKKLEQTVEANKMTLSRIMPELLAIANIFEKKPEIRFFEGAEGIRTVYKDMLSYPDQEITAWITDAFIPFDRKWIYDYFIPERLKKKIWVRAIASGTEPMKKFAQEDLAHLRKTKIIPQEKAIFKVEVDLYGGYHVAIISFSEKIALIIESRDIYDTLKSIFEINWESLG